jgi:hypothetical protein
MKKFTISGVMTIQLTHSKMHVLTRSPRRVRTMPILNNFDSFWLRRIFLGLTIMGTSLEAQSPRLSPTEIAQIVDAALQAVIPPEKMLTQVTVAERGVRFDFGQTLAAFGYQVDGSTARSTLKLRRPVVPGARALLSDCGQAGDKPCKLLGKATYVSLTPISATDSEARVWLHVSWVTTFPTRAYLSGFSTEVYLSRSPSGPWKFVRTGRQVIA